MVVTTGIVKAYANHPWPLKRKKTVFTVKIYLQGVPALREFRVHGRLRNLNFLYTMGPRDMRIFNFIY